MVLFRPFVDGRGDAAATRGGLRNVYLLGYHDVMVSLLELVGDVRRDVVLGAARVADDDVQIAAALAGQLAKGVEGGVETPLPTVHSYGEAQRGRLLAHLATSEEAAAGLVGDESLAALDILCPDDGLHLEGIGLDDGV